MEEMCAESDAAEEGGDDNSNNNADGGSHEDEEKWDEEKWDEEEETEEDAREDLLFQIDEAKRAYRMQVSMNAPASTQEAYKASWKDLAFQEKNLSAVFQKRRQEQDRIAREKEQQLEDERLAKIAATQDKEAMSKIPWGSADSFDSVVLDGHEWRVTHVSMLSTDGSRVVSAGDDETLRTYDVELRKKIFNQRKW